MPPSAVPPRLLFVCSTCSAQTVSQLSGWQRWYTAGEQWQETCPSCGTRYHVTLTATPTRPPTSQPSTPARSHRLQITHIHEDGTETDMSDLTHRPSRPRH